MKYYCSYTVYYYTVVLYLIYGQPSGLAVLPLALLASSHVANAIAGIGITATGIVHALVSDATLRHIERLQGKLAARQHGTAAI